MQVKGAGAGYMMKTAYAEHTPSGVVFYMFLKDGRAGEGWKVYAPKLTPQQGAKWIAQRVRAFGSAPGAREGNTMAILRKTLAAQGEDYVKELVKELDVHGKMEWDMMVEFHDMIANKDQLMPPIREMEVFADGGIRGFTDKGISQAGKDR